MSKRFFEKSQNIDALDRPEIDEFLAKEKLVGKVVAERVEDFYNMLSCVAAGEEVKMNGQVDYDFFNCQTPEDVNKIDSLRDIETEYLSSINPDILTHERLLKAAAAVAYQFEKMMNSGDPIPKGEELNCYLRNLFEYQENLPDNENPTFGELLDLNFDFLKYIALLSSKRAFLKKNGRLVRSQYGNISKYTPMDDFSEIYNMDLLQVVMPNFGTKLAQKDVYVRSKFERVERGQNLIILVDDSGSMSHEVKKAMLRAALTLKIREISENNHVYVGTFERDLFGFKKLEKGVTFESLRSFIFLNKGGTDVNGCILETIRQIKARKLMNREGGHYNLSEDSFEVMVLNDGEDHVDETFHPTIKTHALCLLNHNAKLKNICHRSGGTYFHMRAGNE